MDKLELLCYLQNIDDKSGGFKKKESIKKRYPEIYEELIKIDFPEHFTFVQKLWHFLQDDYTIHKCKCGNDLKFIDIRNGYRTFCSNKHCKYALEYNKTTLQKSRKPESLKQVVNTIIEKNDSNCFPNKSIQKITKERCGEEKFDEIQEINMIVDYCCKSEFPGNSKWASNHPIWDCNVGNRLPPRIAWSNKDFILKAVNNLFYIIKKDKKVRKSFLKEFDECIIEDNKIISSTHRFLELILNRFTIAKIAPKVTAISGRTVKNIIDNSGIDISKGVYVPMSGFGGIIEGVKMWSDENGIDVKCECYDINPNLCKWYGWTEKDMLNQKVITDKVCICCPPFGKRYEHWKGTPKEMSDKPFKEWYKLIKEYVISPQYIIIGPEIGGNNLKTGLFKKSTGVMVWTDDMINNIKLEN